jgi:hypothetical protein
MKRLFSFGGDYGPCWLTVLKVHPPIIKVKGLKHMQQFQAGWNISLSLFLHAFEPNKWCAKNSLLSGGLETVNPRPLSHESPCLNN